MITIAASLIVNDDIFMSNESKILVPHEITFSIHFQLNLYNWTQNGT